MVGHSPLIGLRFRLLTATLSGILVAGVVSPMWAACPTISAGYYHALALKDDATVYAWGRNAEGEIGNGMILGSFGLNSPVQVKDATGAAFLSSIVAIAGGRTHSLAIATDGTVWAWGDDGAGQLGDGLGGPGVVSPLPVGQRLDGRWCAHRHNPHCGRVLPFPGAS